MTKENSLLSIWSRLMKSRIFLCVLFLLALPLLFCLTIVKIVFFTSADEATGNPKQGRQPKAEPIAAAPVTPIPAAVHAAAPEPVDAAAKPVTTQKPGPCVATLHHVVQIDDAVVNFGIYTGDAPRISRLIKVRTDRLSWQRARIAFRRDTLPDFTPALAAAMKLPYTLAGAIACTKRDIKGLNSSASAAVEASKVKAIPTVDFDADAADDMKPTARPTVATGVVTSAGTVKVTPTGGKPYSAFQIVVTDGPTRAIFTGVDLQEKFNNNVFGMHDRIYIQKIREDFEVDVGGRKSKRQKNTYKIEVLEKAQN